MLELRKDIFADERDDNLKEIAKAHSARICSVMSTGASLISTTTNCRACCI